MTSNQKPRQNNRSGRHSNKQKNRGRNQNGRGGSSKKQSQQPLTTTRQVDSHGPAGKIRGNVKQLYDKYKELAHENKTKDRTDSEAYGQYAHHYYMLYSEIAAAEAAMEVEREAEKVRQQEEAAENQSNIASFLADGSNENSEFTIANSDDELPCEKKMKKPRRKIKKVDPDVAPELPLESSGLAEKTKKVRKPRKVKEEVAE
ncbi:MAG: DUF4167 domain-containing protein [Kordiimonadaceae bacterium]|nr:DUF4167 domain-containing protein [Kordiimonadaceae bacterium]